MGLANPAVLSGTGCAPNRGCIAGARPDGLSGLRSPGDARRGRRTRSRWLRSRHPERASAPPDACNLLRCIADSHRGGESGCRGNVDARPNIRGIRSLELFLPCLLFNTAGFSGSVAAPFVAGCAALGSGDRPTGSRCHQTASHHVPIERPMTCRRLPARVAALWFPPASSAAAAVLISARLPTDFMYCARRFSLSRHANGFSYRWSPVRFSRTYRSPTAIRSGSGCCFSLSAWPPARCRGFSARW